VFEVGLKSLVGVWKQCWPICRVIAPLLFSEKSFAREFLIGKDKQGRLTLIAPHISSSPAMLMAINNSFPAHTEDVVVSKTGNHICLADEFVGAGAGGLPAIFCGLCLA